MKKLITFAIVAVLTGCRVGAEIPVSSSQLKAENPKPVIADLYIELPSCDDYEDSRNPSESLTEAKESIPTIFTGADFVECFKRKMDSIAQFKIPVAITKDASKLGADINLVSNENMILALAADSGFMDRLKQQNEQNLVSYSYEIRIRLTADSDIKSEFHSVYVDERPVVFGRGTIVSGETFNLTLSDVSVTQLIQEGFTPVLKPY